VTKRASSPIVPGSRPAGTWGILAICLLAPWLAGCHVGGVSAASEPPGAGIESQIETTALRPGYRLCRVSEGVIRRPAIYGLRLAVLNEEGRIVARPRRFADLAPFVGPISNEAQALAFVRLYTQCPDFLLFEDRLLEIRPAESFLRLPRTVADQLEPMQVSSSQRGFHLARDLVHFDEKSRALGAFRSDETVERNGQYRLRVERSYPNGDAIELFLPE